MHGRVRAVLAGAVLVSLAATGCAGGEDEAAADTGAPPVTTAGVTTLPPTAAAPTTTVAPEPEFGTDAYFLEVLRELFAIRDEAYTTPDPDLIPVIYHPNCPCLVEETRHLSLIERAGQRYDGYRYEIQSAEFIAWVDAPKTAAVVEWVATYSDSALIAMDGTVVEQFLGRTERRRAVLLYVDEFWVWQFSEVGGSEPA